MNKCLLLLRAVVRRFSQHTHSGVENSSLKIKPGVWNEHDSSYGSI